MDEVRDMLQDIAADDAVPGVVGERIGKDIQVVN